MEKIISKKGTMRGTIKNKRPNKRPRKQERYESKSPSNLKLEIIPESKCLRKKRFANTVAKATKNQNKEIKNIGKVFLSL